MRYGIAILAVIFLIIIGSVVLIGRGNRSDQTTPQGSRVTTLADYDNNPNASVSWTMQGEYIGDDQYRAVRVTVTPATRKAEVLSGYAHRVEKTVEFPNSHEAFATFTRALDHLGFGRERNVAVADERGVCPQGNRFIYRLTDGSQEIMRTWSASCSNREGPFAGRTPGAIRELFRDQIPDYNQFVRGVQL